MLGNLVHADTIDFFLLDSKKDRSSNLTVIGNLFSYKDINLSGGDSSDSFIYAPTQGIAVGLRAHKIFLISMVYRQNTVDQRKSAGVALRGYMPGVFLIGDSIHNFLIDFSKRRLHSYVEGEVATTTSVDSATGLSSKYFENSTRLGVEITMFRGFFLDVSYGLATYRSNNSWITGLGLGIRF